MNNKEKFKLYNKEIYAAKRKNYRNELRDFVNELKSNKPCLECNKIFPAICMDYDHRDSSQKIKSVSRLIQLKYSKENILIEISKCDLVCVNCHRARTQQKYGIRTKITSKEKKIRASKNKPCSDCNQIYPWFIMEFDHRDRAQKKGPVSQTKLENLAEEIGKCDIVCVVCHRLRSSKQMSWGQQNNDQHLIFDAK